MNYAQSLCEAWQKGKSDHSERRGWVSAGLLCLPGEQVAVVRVAGHGVAQQLVDTQRHSHVLEAAVTCKQRHSEVNRKGGGGSG